MFTRIKKSLSMFKKLLIIIIVFASSLSSLSVFSQNSVNDYKYVIVPNKYDFLKERDEYQLNSISHFLFEKYGFTALKENDIFPEDLRFNPCLALKSDVIHVPGSFQTKLRIELRDCKGEVIYLSDFGVSYDKMYAVAYNKALRNAFLHLQVLNYKYQPNETILAMGSTAHKADREEIEQLKEELAALKEEKELESVTKVVAESSLKTSTDTVEQVSEKQETLLFAQKTLSGYQLVDKSSKVTMVLLSTKNPTVFIVQDKNAVVLKENNSWILSENIGSKVINTKLNIEL